MGLLLLAPVITKAVHEEVNYSADFGECYPDPVYEESFVGKTLVAANLRSVACMNGSKIMAVLPANSKIKVLAKTDGWYKIKTLDGKIGWMGAWIIAKTSDTAFNEVKKEAVNTTVKETKNETVKTASFGTVVSQIQGLELSELRSLKEKIVARIAELEKKELVKKEEAAKKEALKKSETTTVNNSGGTILLSAEVLENKVKLAWQLSGMTSPNGFKIVVSEHENPVYPGNEYHYLSDHSVRADEWNLSAGTYYFRVCEYLGGKCGIYSNNVKVLIGDN